MEHLREFLARHPGADVVTVSRLLGHRNIETTMLYLHTDLQTMRDGVGRLNFSGWKVIGTNLAQNGQLLDGEAERVGFEPTYRRKAVT